MRKVWGAVVATALVAAPLSFEVASSKPSDARRPLDLFADVFEIVQRQYVRPISEEKLIEGAIDGMLAALDPHSNYMSAKENSAFMAQTTGAFGGLGLEVSAENGQIKVESPIDGTPAARANIKAGDLITQIDGEPITGVSLDDAVEKMRGAPGTLAKVTIRHDAKAEPFDVTLKREIIKMPSVKSRVEAGDIGYIRISSFSDQTQPGLDKAIAGIKAALGNNVAGYVIDLRNNPGGLVNAAVSVSNTFLDDGEIVSMRGRDPAETERIDAKPGQDKVKGIPVAVLINGGTASAAEIVSGALQDHHRAIIMGTQSFGKGSVQTILPLKNHGSLKLTTAEYFTPSGRSIQAKGITPDIEVKPARLEELAEAARPHEADLKGALPNPNAPAAQAVPAAAAPGQPSAGIMPSPAEMRSGGKISAAPQALDTTPADPAQKTTPVDYQLARAVDLLHGVATFKSRLAN